MPRYKLVIEYDGTPVRRLAASDQRPSVQQAVEEAIATFLGRGRTDSLRWSD